MDTLVKRDFASVVGFMRVDGGAISLLLLYEELSQTAGLALGELYRTKSSRKGTFLWGGGRLGGEGQIWESGATKVIKKSTEDSKQGNGEPTVERRATKRSTATS